MTMCIISWVLIAVIIPQLQCLSIDEEHYTPEDYFCMEKVKVDKSFIEDHVYENITVARGDDKMDEFMECWGQEMKLFDENFVMIPAAWKHYITIMVFNFIGMMEDPKKEEMADMAVDKCKRLKPGRNKGDTVIQAFNCVIFIFYKYSKVGHIEL